MADLEVTGLVLGMIETNSYIVGNRQTKEALLIDPSDGADRIIGFLTEKEYRPVAIYLTHGHDDHFGSVNELKREYGLLTYIMKEEEEFVQSVNFNLSGLFRHPRVTEPDMFFVDGQKVRVFADLTVTFGFAKVGQLLFPGRKTPFHGRYPLQRICRAQ